MMTESEKSLERRKFSILLATLAMLIGFAGVAGWSLNVESLKQVFPALGAIRANAAVCLILAACSVVLLRSESIPPFQRWLGRILGFLVAVIAGATLTEHFYGVDLGIDQLLFQNTSVSAEAAGAASRMQPAAAVHLFLLGINLLLLDVRVFGRLWPAHWFILALATGIALVFLYYLYGVETMGPLAGHATLPVHTALALFLLYSGVLMARPDRGFTALLLGESLGSVVARRMLPALLVIVVLGWLRNLGVNAGFYGSGFATAAFVVLTVLLFTTLIWWTASSINETEARRLEASELLRHRSAQFETLLNQAPLGVYLVDADFRIRNVNPTARPVFGGITDVIGRDFDEVIHLLWEKEYADEMVRLFRHTLQTGIPYATPERIERRLNRNVTDYYEWRIDRIQIPDGRFGVVCYFRDISAQVRIRAEIAESEERFRSLVSILTDVPWTAAADGAFVLPQDAWSKYTGQTAEQARGFGWAEAIHPDDRGAVLQAWKEACRTRSVYNGQGRLWCAATREWRHYEARAMPLLESDGSIREWVGTYTDVHDRRVAETALRQSRKELQEELADSKLLQSISAEIIHEESAETLYQRLIDGALGIMRSQCATLQMLVSIDDIPEELHLLAQRGFDVQAADLWQRVDLDSRCMCGDALRTRQRIVIPDMDRCDFVVDSRHMAVFPRLGIRAAQTTPLVSRSGKVVGMISTHWDHPHEPSERDLRLLDILARQAADLLERKQAEDALHATQAQLVRHAGDLEKTVAERTARLRETVQELEGFSYSITHDLRTPLRALQSFADILCEEHAAGLDETAKSYLQRIHTSARRMDKLIEDVLVYSRVVRMDLKLEPVDVHKLLRGMLESYPHLQEPAAEVVIDGDLPHAMGNEAALTQCFSNLLGNAIKFVAPGIKPRVRISADANGTKVRFWVADNGIGIDPRHCRRVFDTFQRLSTAYEGTGIGLTIVRKAAERLGGAVGVESALGQGSRFWLDLPAVTQPESQLV